MQDMIENSENFMKGIYCNIEHHGVNQIFVSLYIRILFTEDIGPMFQL